MYKPGSQDIVRENGFIVSKLLSSDRSSKISKLISDQIGHPKLHRSDRQQVHSA